MNKMPKRHILGRRTSYDV